MAACWRAVRAAATWSARTESSSSARASVTSASTWPRAARARASAASDASSLSAARSGGLGDRGGGGPQLVARPLGRDDRPGLRPSHLLQHHHAGDEVLVGVGGEQHPEGSRRAGRVGLDHDGSEQVPVLAVPRSGHGRDRTGVGQLNLGDLCPQLRPVGRRLRKVVDVEDLAEAVGDGGEAAAGSGRGLAVSGLDDQEVRVHVPGGRQRHVTLGIGLRVVFEVDVHVAADRRTCVAVVGALGRRLGVLRGALGDLRDAPGVLLGAGEAGRRRRRRQHGHKAQPCRRRTRESTQARAPQLLSVPGDVLAQLVHVGDHAAPPSVHAHTQGGSAHGAWRVRVRVLTFGEPSRRPRAPAGSFRSVGRGAG